MCLAESEKPIRRSILPREKFENCLKKSFRLILEKRWRNKLTMAYYCLAGILWVVDFSNNRYEFPISTRVCKAVLTVG